ncbi:Hypothetical protein CINCED_3A010245 [Cinara cedri]|uniref:Uncharacterized protein n=1 Tax=Cinara cedri TaxID=506608 RepID=A0A5E4MS91_9HEMI|nr:Hypothetical protein CINCED_3A010245 [Cinara cedri]
MAGLLALRITPNLEDQTTTTTQGHGRALKINNQSYYHNVPYIHRYGPKASSINISSQYQAEHSPNYGPGTFRSEQYHKGYSTQQNYGPGAFSSGQNRCNKFIC